MNFSIKKIALTGLLVVAVITGLVVTAVPALAANPSTITLESKHISNGVSFTVTVTAATTVAVAGGQATITYDHTKLTCTDATYNASPKFFGSAEYDVPAIIDNANGKVSLTSTTGSTATVTGTGVWATLTFTALAAANDSVVALNYDIPNSYLASNAPAALPTDLNVGNITVGAPPQADLTVSNVVAHIDHTGTNATTDPTTYHVTFQVNNIGNLNAGASTAWVTVDTQTPRTVATPSVNQTGNSGPLTTGIITLTGTYDTITVTADAVGNAIVESNENNNTSTITYSFSYPVPGQTTDINGTFQKTLSFTQPASVDFGADMQLGDNSITQSINVKSNEYWTLNVLGSALVLENSATPNEDAGKLTKYTISTGTYDPYIKLHRQLHIITAGGYLTPFPTASGNITPVNRDVALTGTAQLLATGIPEGQLTSGSAPYTRLGETRTLYFSQFLLASDAHLQSSGDVYHNQAVFQISSVGF